jgi:hypothetical protein
MLRPVVICLSIGVLAAPGTSARQVAPNGQTAFGRDLDAMAARLGAGRPTPRQLIADAQLIASGYRSLGPHVRRFGPADYTLNRLVARRSLEWLSRAGAIYRRDPLVAEAFLRSYDSIGGFYAHYAPFYRPGAFVAYAGATRLAQRLILEGLDDYGFDRELDRFALAYGAMAALNGALLVPWNTPRDLPDTSSPKSGRTAAIKPVELPEVDVTQLDAGQKEAWNEAKTRFRNVAPHVYQARVLLNQLSERLQRQRMTLSAQYAADALKMQSFLEDAVDLMLEGRFDTAVEALRRADYVRTRLKGATGQ